MMVRIYQDLLRPDRGALDLEAERADSCGVVQPGHPDRRVLVYIYIYT